jgi:hypothetical protein
MKIGLFGDSYIDLVWHRYPGYQVPQKDKPWCMRLLEHYNSPVISSGLGGSNQYYAIKEWLSYIRSSSELDYAIFTFTWANRLYHSNPRTNEIICLRNVLKDQPDLPPNEKLTIEAADNYYNFLYDQAQHDFNFELQVKWILDLPEKYHNIKFIFLPNSEESRAIALKYFKNGILLNFAFSSISALEGEIVNQYPFIENKIGHLTEQNHERFKNKMVDIIDKNVYNTIIDINYEEFKL